MVVGPKVMVEKLIGLDDVNVLDIEEIFGEKLIKVTVETSEMRRTISMT